MRPVVGRRIDDDALHRRRGVVARPACGGAAVVPGDDHAAPVGIHQHLGRVKPQAACGGRRPLDPVAVQLPGPDAGYDEVENGALLESGLSALDERERTIVELRFFEGLTQSEIAARIGISQMHVSRLLRRSLAVMRGRLESAVTEQGS